MITAPQKPIIGITSGDLNGIGIECILKTFADPRMMEFCTPVVFASNKCINFYRKSIAESNVSFNSTKDWSKINPKQLNVFNVWEEEVLMNPGVLNENGLYF